VLWSPTIAIAAYFVLGAVVLASRLVFPNFKSSDREAEAAHSASSATNETGNPDLPLAA
jgi:hypothetical protein